MRKQGLAVLILASAALSVSGQEPAKPGGDAPPTVPSISDRVRGLERHDGFLPFYWDARRGQLLVEVVPGPQEFLYGSGLAGGAGLLDVDLDRGNDGPARRLPIRARRARACCSSRSR